MVYLGLEWVTRRVWHNVMVDNVNQTIWSATVLISIVKIGVYLTKSALGRQTECQLLPGFIISSQPFHFAALLVHYPFSAFCGMYCSLLQSNLTHYNCLWATFIYSIAPTCHWLLPWKVIFGRKPKREVLEQHLRPMNPFLTAWGTTKRQHHALHKKAFVLIYIILYFKLGLYFVEIMSILIVSTARHVLTVCFEIWWFSSREFFSLSGGVHLGLETSPLCQ